MTSTTRAWLLNGRDHALRVECDGRRQPVQLALLALDDQSVRLQMRLGQPGLRAQPQLGRAARRELDQLLLRLRTGRDPRRCHLTARAEARQLRRLLRPLGLSAADVKAVRTPHCPTAARLHLAGRDRAGRPLWLTAATARAWRGLHRAARADCVDLQVVSGFRGPHYQAGLLARKLGRGQDLREILAVNAVPGYSEHHLGTTLDLHGGEGMPLEESFEDSEAFAWLQRHGPRFGFSMSYPRNNPAGIAYEPWHWRYRGSNRTRPARPQVEDVS